ncbi:MAG: Carboxypeptidase regulatory-like domain [Thermoplasmata archaeon]|jgi:hypothetical protein|nr:Carboxypeptidase regulatory-like domain [Thermoplasmata archaeon]
MSTLRLALLAFTLCGVTLAGCASKATPDSQTTTVPGVDVNATPTTGVIRGIVVDTAVRPLAGVHLSLKAGDKTMATDSLANGGFGFQNLAPGTYFITAQKAGFNEVRVSADVKANDNAPAITKVAMEANPSTKPFVESYVFKGFMDCSTTAGAPGVGSLGVALCSIPNGASCGLDPVPCSPNVTTDNTQVHYQVQRVPTWVQSELVWQSTQALGSDLSVMYSWTCDTNGGFLCDHSVDGPSPLLLTAGAKDIQKIGIGNSTDIYVRVFNTATSASMGTVGATVEQDFLVYTHVFYGFVPPEGYRFSKDGEPTMPS